MVRRFNRWRRKVGWSGLTAYIVMLVVVIYVINDLYGLVDTPATNEIQVEIHQANPPSVIFIPVGGSGAPSRTHDARGGGGGSTGGSTSPSSTGSPPDSSGGGSGGTADTGNNPDGNSPSGGGSGATPPSQPTLPSVPDILDNVNETVCNTVPPNVQLPNCP